MFSQNYRKFDIPKIENEYGEEKYIVKLELQDYFCLPCICVIHFKCAVLRQLCPYFFFKCQEICVHWEILVHFSLTSYLKIIF